MGKRRNVYRVIDLDTGEVVVESGGAKALQDFFGAKTRPSFYARYGIPYKNYRIEASLYIPDADMTPRPLDGWEHCLKSNSPWTAESLAYFLGLREMIGLKNIPQPGTAGSERRAGGREKEVTESE